MTQKQLAIKFGVSEGTIRRWKKNGILIGDILEYRPVKGRRRDGRISAEHRLALSKSLRGNKNSLGHKHSEKTRLQLSRSNSGKHHTDVTKNKLRENAIRRNYGGYIPGSGRGKKGWVRNVWCDSSWEAAFVVWHLDNGKNISRNEIRFTFVWNVKKKNYLPDFIVDGCLVEIKGYMTPLASAKIACVDSIKVIGKAEIQFFLDYAISSYGKNFAEKLYSESRQI
jgi:hypothetical protein